MTVNELLLLPQYTIGKETKDQYLLPLLKEKFRCHIENSEHFKNIMISIGYDERRVASLSDLPYLPVRLFKNLDLKSIKNDDVFKILTSSGTTSQTVSKIYLNKETALLQTRALASILTSFIGNQRLPMVIVDYKNVLKNRNEFSARGAGILGLSNFGRDHLYILDDNMELDILGLESFLEKHGNNKIFFFGFTFMIWQYLIEKLRFSNLRLNITNGILVHSGGWKKLIDLHISNDKFKESCSHYLGIDRVHNFYGMVEQVGGVYMECDSGFFHAPNFTDIFIRSTKNLNQLGTGELGLVQTISILPGSYPGNSILTEDIGMVHGVDNCACGRKGTHFSITGRIPKAELRGCSDTHASEAGVIIK